MSESTQSKVSTKSDKCALCAEKPKWAIYAAYDVYLTETHPIMKRYPAPMAFGCDTHLARILDVDNHTFASTKHWVIKPIV